MARASVIAAASIACAIVVAIAPGTSAWAQDVAGPAASDEGNAALVDPGAAPAVNPGDGRQAENRAAMFGAAAFDLMGFEPSLYTGKWFMPNKEDVRRCILDKESNFNYRATNGVYHGAYQLSAALAVGATWMMQREVRKEMGEEGVKIVQDLRQVTPNKWNRYWQDRAFWTIWRNGEGRDHWGGVAAGC